MFDGFNGGFGALAEGFGFGQALGLEPEGLGMIF
ncbi:Hypothetical protein Bdt_2595 [Bdellovibrio bacteriovorus str. Tiberius]|uniref:Uncharacterized protein n=1 Tax=Bdellovibrio bacteriovorus str. Tiberius TaxID=1069642 RepID=K7YX73_BDEBC|nr:Hypothetical protein Bdt_2595 [Bdellovibrio bacteriovorus str. Tiberius]